MDGPAAKGRLGGRVRGSNVSVPVFLSHLNFPQKSEHFEYRGGRQFRPGTISLGIISPPLKSPRPVPPAPVTGLAAPDFITARNGWRRRVRKCLALPRKHNPFAAVTKDGTAGKRFRHSSSRRNSPSPVSTHGGKLFCPPSEAKKNFPAPHSPTSVPKLSPTCHSHLRLSICP